MGKADRMRPEKIRQSGFSKSLGDGEWSCAMAIDN